MTNPLKLGIAGLGTVGAGVLELMACNGSSMSSRAGRKIEVSGVCALDKRKNRSVDISNFRWVDDPVSLAQSNETDVFVELIGGEEGAARASVAAALKAGKHVVTANKALLALHGDEIFSAAEQKGVDVAFEAAVGGGIPVLRALREGLSANRIQAVEGILNGTTNYVLTQMEQTAEDFEVVLKRAQELGYAEADPTFDVEGVDAAHKLALLTSMAFGSELDFKSIPTEGISKLVPLDLELAAEFGYRIKLLGIAKAHRDAEGVERIEARVHPTLIPETSLLARVDGAMNAIAVHGDAVGPTLFYGAGAGELPTASAVVADLVEIAREIRRGGAGRVAPLSYLPEALRALPLLPMGEIYGRCYLRFTAVDRPGVLANLTGVLGEHEIGTESVIQKGRGGDSVPVLVRTHPVREAAIRSALEEIDRLPDVTAPTRLIRIEEDL